jgi:hypothetical protein
MKEKIVSYIQRAITCLPWFSSGVSKGGEGKGELSLSPPNDPKNHFYEKLKFG